ncbi:MAG: hypothetical protein U0794_09770 [Isosphaeraceae bacterium]
MAWRVILGGVVGGILLFVAGAVAHMATPLGTAGLSVIPAEKEAATLGSLKEAVPSSGMYVFPGMDFSRSMTPSEERAWQDRMKAGPTGLLVIRREGGDALSPGQLLTELASNIAAATVVAILLGMTQPNLGFLARVLFVVLIALTGWLSSMVSFWNWYGFDTLFTLAEAANELLGWTLAGVGLALIVRPRSGGSQQAAATN